MNMFDRIEMAPPDPIIGLTEAYRHDTNPNKINLGVGVFRDADGNTPILASVREAEQRIIAKQSTKDYLPIDGSPQYTALICRLLFGPDHELIKSGRSAAVQTPGGTGAIRVAANYLKAQHPQVTVWMSEPTWPNHPKIMAAAGLTTRTYAYFNSETNELEFAKMIDALDQIPEGDVVLLHGCCHNPTGVDPSPEQWKQIDELLARRRLLPLVDLAYQGFGESLTDDAQGLAALCRSNPELLICSSYSKNFSLYSERVGALSVVAGSPSAAAAVVSHLKVGVRTNYSNPPRHGAAIVAEVLGDRALRDQWEQEVEQMRRRINDMRLHFVETLAAKGVRRDFSFIARQHGMFSFTGLGPDQVQKLREQHSVYVVAKGGRINVAAMTQDNMPRLCDAIVDVL